MKNKIKNFIKKNKKYLIVLLIGLIFMLVGYISWDVYFSKFEIFKKEEKKLLTAGERYYQFRKQYLPKEGEYREVTLKTLYDNVEMEALYAPKSKKMCSLDSWVRVYKKDGEYHYIYYLECGSFKTKIDHEAPTMKLNGDDTIYIALGTPYEELGVKEVNDNKDGKIDVKNVDIDSTNVNTSKIGEYEVTYTVKDSTYNRTVVTRKVVVSNKFTNTIRTLVNAEGYYQGESNNYVLFSGMLWRIVKVNEDGTVKITLDQPSSSLMGSEGKYEDSNIDKWLNEYFYKKLTNPDDYIVEKEYCVGNINSMFDYGTYCDEKVTRKVGMLDIYEYYKTYDGINYSIKSKHFALPNKVGEQYALADYKNVNHIMYDNSSILPVRPTITLNSNMNIISGDGTKQSPYKLNDYTFANKGDILNTRIVGEYFEYSGMPFRIIGIDKDKNVRAIMADYWVVQPDNMPITFTYTNKDSLVFDPKDEENPGYLINNEKIEYIDTKAIIKSTYDIPTIAKDKSYDKYSKKEVTAKMFLPKTYELFSTQQNDLFMIAYIDKSLNDGSIYLSNASTSMVYDVPYDTYKALAIKAVLTIKGDLRIESGKGYISSPYKLK